jgi:hypothetical protein
MKKTFLLLGLFAFSTLAKAQTKHEYAIYDSILAMHKDAYPAPVTALQTLKDFNFKDLKWHDFNPKDSLNNEWKHFFNNVDISHMQPKQLDAAFLAKYPKTTDRDREINFSPIIVSPDKVRAICGYHLFAAGETIYLFEKKNGKWRFRRSYFVSVE